MAVTVSPTGPVVLSGDQPGITIVPASTPLARLNYFDGRFLRAADLQGDQGYLRGLTHLATAAGGSGVVAGLDVALAGAVLRIDEGLAFDGSGRPLLLPAAVDVPVADLLASSQAAPPAPAPAAAGRPLPAGFGECTAPAAEPGPGLVASADWFVVALCHAEALCGEADVYGRLCEDACATTTDRPTRVEGVVVVARPLALDVALPASAAYPFSAAHLRSRLASAYFETERRRLAPLVSGGGLRSAAWCRGAELAGVDCVPVALLVRAGTAVAFVDGWTVRRERIEPPPRRYWDWRLRRRPWDVFLAQVAQFQCQLVDAVGGSPGGNHGDRPCADLAAALALAEQAMAEVTGVLEKEGGESARAVLGHGAFQALGETRLKVRDALKGSAAATGRVLLDAGIVELPPAGYLPVDPSSAVALEDQVARLLGEGVDLRFCAVPADAVAAALDEARHLDRIPLTAGLDDPDRRPPVDVLVPDGTVVGEAVPPAAVRSWATGIELYPARPERGFGGGDLDDLAPGQVASLATLQGLATADPAAGPGFAFHAAAAMEVGDAVDAGAELAVRTIAARMAAAGPRSRPIRIEDVPRERAGRPFGVAAEGTVLRVRGEAARAARRVHDLKVSAMGGRRRPAAGGSAAAGGTRVAAVWLRLKLDGDPTAAVTGDVLGMAVEAAAVVAAGRPEGSRLTVTGDLLVDSSIGRHGTAWVRGTLRGSMTTTDVGGSAAETTRRVELPVTIEPVLAPVGTRIVQMTVRLPAERGVALELQLSMADGLAKLDANVSLAFVKTSPNDRRAVDLGAGTATRFPVTEATFVADQTVLDPGTAANALARSAVAILGDAFEDPSFAPTALARLFPGEVAVAPAKERVRAVTDWVLFHRRRDRRCAGAVPAQPARPDRRFDLYTADVDGPEQAGLLRRALYRDDDAGLARLGVRRVDTVTFGGGTAALTSSAAALASSWAGADPGPLLTYAATGARDGGDGPAVEGDRLARLLDLLGPASPVPAGAVDVLGTVPSALDRPGIDGAVLVATGRPSTTTCIDVRDGDGVLEKLPVLLREDRIAEIMAASQRLGVVRFDGLAAMADDAEAVAATWEAVVGPVDVRMIALHRSGDPAAGTPDERSARVHRIWQEFVGIDPPGDVAVGAELGVDCPVALLVFRAFPGGRPVRSPGTRVVGGSRRHWSIGDGGDAEVAGTPLRELDEARFAELEAEGVFTTLGVATWAAGSPDVGVSTTRALADAGLEPGALNAVVVMTPEGYGDRGLVEDRSKQVVDLVGAELSGQDVVVVEVPGEVPGGAFDTVTFVLLDQG